MEKYGISTRKQFVDLFKLAFAYCIPPLEYYQMRLHQWTHSNWLDFVYDFQAASWHEALTYPNQRQAQELLNNKLDLENFLKQHNLSTILSLLNTKPHVEISRDEVDRFPDEFFLKPAIGNRGSGCLSVKKDHARAADIRFEFTWFKNAAIYIYKDIDDINRILTTREYLIQPLIKNHSEFTALLATDKLATIRLITVSLNNKRVAVTAVLEAAIPDKPSYYWNVAIDTATGKFIEPVNSDLTDNKKFKNWYKNLKDKICPDWQNLKSLCLDAHTKLPDILTIDWDVALAADGPVIVEGNVCWGVQQYQNLMQIPLLQTELGKTYTDFLHLPQTR